MVKSSSRGMALPLVLVLLLALTAFGHGALLLSRRELKASWAFRDLVRAGQAAEVGLRIAWAVPVGPGDSRTLGSAMHIVSGETDEGLVYETSRRWLDKEFFLLESVGSLRGWGGERRAGWIGWVLDPGIRITSFLGAVEVGVGVQKDPGTTFSHDTRYESGNVGRPPWADGPCEAWVMPLQARSGPTLGDPTGERGITTIPSLALLGGGELLRRIEELHPGTDSTRVGRDCWRQENRVSARGSSGDLIMDGGVECGLLVVEGNLRLKNKASFSGLALVGGDMSVDEESTFSGMAKVGETLILREKSRFFGSACQALQALEGLPSLRKPLLLYESVGWGGL